MANTSNLTNSSMHDHDYQTRGFRRATILLGALVVACLVAENIHDSVGNSWVGIAAPALILAAYVTAFFRPLKQTIDTPYFATLSLLLIALGTALGTFVTQNTPPDTFTVRYGLTGSTILRRLQLDDVFHSWWYVGLFALLAASLLKISARRKFTFANLGFHLAHLGPIIVLAGFWTDYFYGFRGIIQLETGQSSNIVTVFQGSTNYVADTTALDFSLRLDNFEFEKHDPDYRIQLWRNQAAAANPHAQPTANGHAQTESQPEIVASVPLVIDKVNRIYGTDLYFRLREFYPNFTFDYSYPDLTETVEPKDPGALIDLQTPLGKTTVQFLSNRPGRNVLADASHLGAWLEFYWETPAELTKALNGQIDEEWAEVNRVILVGKDRQLYYLTEGQLSQQPLETGQFYLFPDRDKTGFTVKYVYPDASLLRASAISDGDELLNPVAKVEVWGKNWEKSKDAFLYPGGAQRGGTFAIPNSDYFLAFESFRDMETKFWRSDLSVLNGSGEVVKSRPVLVNEPMLHRGYRFYQTDYDPNNPDYSGIGVSHEPGLYVIYFGFFVLFTGCFLMFYGRLTERNA